MNSQTINNQILCIKKHNYNVGQHQKFKYTNAFLIPSSNQLLNQIANPPPITEGNILYNKSDDLTQNQNRIRKQKKEKYNSDRKDFNMDAVEDEDYGAMIQNEVYNKPDERDTILNYKIDKKLSNDENVVYVGKTKVLHGLRGTTNRDDFRADLEIAYEKFNNVLKRTIGFNIPINLEWWETKYKERILRQDIFYNKLKEKYPDKEIIMGGHSLAGVLIKDIFHKNKGDSIKGYTFNGYFHPGDIEPDSRLTHKGIALDLVSLHEQKFGKQRNDYVIDEKYQTGTKEDYIKYYYNIHKSENFKPTIELRQNKIKENKKKKEEEIIYINIKKKKKKKKKLKNTQKNF